MSHGAADSGTPTVEERPIPLDLRVFLKEPSQAWEAAWEVTAALLQEMDEEVSDSGAELLVALIPARLQIEPGAWQDVLAQEEAWQQESWMLEQPVVRLQDTLKAQSIPYLNLLPAFRAAAEQGNLLYFEQDAHWNENGHRLQM